MSWDYCDECIRRQKRDLPPPTPCLVRWCANSAESQRAIDHAALDDEDDALRHERRHERS